MSALVRGLTALVAVTLLAGCAAAPAPPGTAPPNAVTVHRCGKDISFDRPPQRVLLGWPTSMATLTALGVGASAFGYLSGKLAGPPPGAPDLQQVSPEWTPAREPVIAARPDLLLANDENQVAGTGGGVSYDDLAAAGAKAFVLGGFCLGTPAPATVDAVYADVHDLGAIFGVPARAAAVTAALQARVAAAAAKRGTAPVKRVAFVQNYDGKLYALSGSYYAAILQGAGLENEFADIKENFAEVSPEQVLTRRPDTIFAVQEHGQDPAQVVAAARAALAASPAARDGQVFALPNATISGGGVGIIDLIEQAATAAYGG